MTENVLLALLGILQTIVAGFITFLIYKARAEIQVVHMAVNSRVDLLLTAIEAMARVKAQRVRARAARLAQGRARTLKNLNGAKNGGKNA